MFNHRIAMNVAVSMLVMSSAATALGSGHTVTISDATIIAKNFAEYNAANHFAAWTDAAKFSAKRVYSTDGVVVSYEVAVTSEDNKKLGYIVVAAQAGNGEVVTAFSSEGKAESELLENYYSQKLLPFFKEQRVSVIRKELIGTSTGAYALGLRFNRNASFLRDVPSENGRYLISVNPSIGRMSFSYKDKQNIRTARAEKTNSVEDAEEDELRDAYLSGNFSSSLFYEESSGKIDKIEKDGAVSIESSAPVSKMSSGVVSGTFSSFSQEKRAWTKGGLTNGVCNAGCTPVAWAIVLEYWDRNGYSKLVSTATDNANNSTTDTDVRWTINELRGYLNTKCSSGYTGNTSYGDITKGISYAKSRGYANSSSSNTYIWSSWWDLMSAIDNKKPPIAALDTNGDKSMDHSAVVFSYIDNSYTSNDSYCVRTGWLSPSKCYTTQNALYGLTKVTIK